VQQHNKKAPAQPGLSCFPKQRSAQSLILTV
jgi:hypothetical protein